MRPSSAARTCLQGHECCRKSGGAGRDGQHWTLHKAVCPHWLLARRKGLKLLLLKVKE
jgi:hypothetical protein